MSLLALFRLHSPEFSQWQHNSAAHANTTSPTDPLQTLNHTTDVEDEKKGIKIKKLKYCE
jgi:hypothetical protein